jgi:hypothetical protein
VGHSVEKARGALHQRLLARRPEIEQTLHNRIDALASSSRGVDPEYVDGLPSAVSAALDFGLAVVRSGAEREPPIPAPLLTQTRLAARNGVGLDTVLRRYLAGYTLLTDFLLEEAAGGTGHLRRDAAPPVSFSGYCLRPTAYRGR